MKYSSTKLFKHIVHSNINGLFTELDLETNLQAIEKLSKYKNCISCYD